MKKIRLFIVLALLMAALTACGSSESKLVGNWEAVDHDWSIWVSSFPEEINFMDDGNASVDNIASTYTIDGNTLNITASWAAISYEFNVSGDTLTLSYDDKTVTYKKK